MFKLPCWNYAKRLYYKEAYNAVLAWYEKIIVKYDKFRREFNCAK